MTIEVTKRLFTKPFQFREFVEQAWFITSVTLMPTILVSIPFGAVISLQVGNLTGQLGAQSFAGAQVAVTAEVAMQGVVRASPEQVVALVYLNQSNTKAGRDLEVSQYMILVTVLRTDSGWLVSDMDTF